MKKIVRFENVDCAHCTAKLELALAKIQGVKEINMNFFAKKMVIDIDEETFDSVKEQILTVTKKQQPKCKYIGL